MCQIKSDCQCESPKIQFQLYNRDNIYQHVTALNRGGFLQLI